MRKISLALALVLFLSFNASADYQIKSDDVRVDSSLFSGVLSSTDTTVQKALEALDEAIGLTESDPIYSAWDKSTGISIGHSQISDWAAATSSFLTSESDPVFSAWLLDTPPIYSETDPIVKAINGIVKSDGTTISAAVSGTDIKTINSISLLGSGDISVTPPTASTIGTLINGAGPKTTPDDADNVAITDSEFSHILKKLTWANLKATLKTYFDDIYRFFFRSSTLTIAASNSKDTINADYVCDGTNDDITINTAIAALPTVGGRIVLLEGDFDITAELTVLNNNTTIEGQGSSTRLLASIRATFDNAAGTLVEGDALTGTTGGRTYTAVIAKIRYDTATSGIVWYHTLSNAANYQDNDVIKKTSDAGITVTLSATPTEQSFNVINLNDKNGTILQNFQVVGGSGGGNSKNLITDNNVAVQDIIINNLFLKSADQNNIYIQNGGSQYFSITNCFLSGQSRHGIVFGGRWSTVSNCIAYSNLGAYDTWGFYLGGNYNVFSANISSYNAGGFFFSSGFSACIGNTASLNTFQGFLVSGGSNSVDNNIAFYNGREGIKSIGSYNKIQGNSCYRNSTSKGYSDILISGSNNNLVTSNYIYSTSGESSTGISLVDSDNNLVTNNYSSGHAVVGLSEDANCTGNQIYGNSVTDTVPYSLSGSSYADWATMSNVGVGITSPRALLDISTGYLVGTGLQLPHVINKIASANVRNSHNAETTSTSATYVKVKTITLPNGLVGQQRFLFDIKTSDILKTAYGRVYRNGVAIGTEQTDTTGTYATKSEDITQTWNPGDTAELWIHNDGTGTTSVQNFQIAYDDNPTVAVISSNS